MQILNLKEVEHITLQLAKEMLSYDEPIPDFSSRFPNILESCIATPFMSFNKKLLYPGLILKAYMLFYLMIKNHPFQNGNKRIAIATLLVFLYKNNKWIKSEINEFYDFTIWIAKSPAKLKNDVLKAIENFIRRHTVKLRSSD